MLKCWHRCLRRDECHDLIDPLFTAFHAMTGHETSHESRRVNRDSEIFRTDHPDLHLCVDECIAMI